MQSTSSTPANRSFRRRAIVANAAPAALLVLLGACEVVESDSKATTTDSAGTPGIVAESARGTVATSDSTADSAATAMSPATADSSLPTVVDDTGVVRIYPPEPRRGGVVFVLA